MAADISINSPEELEAWLKDKPRQWARAIAIRAALRMLPLVERALSWPEEVLDDRRKQGLILRSLRASTIAWAAASYPEHEIAVRTIGRDTNNALDSFTADANAVFTIGTSAALVIAASAALSTAGALSATVLGPDVIKAAVATLGTTDAAQIAAGGSDGAESAVRSIWKAASADAEALEGGMRPERLVREPLWMLGIPQWYARERLSFDKRLRDLGGRWPIWSDWLSRRIVGENTASLPDDLAEELNIRIATQSDDWWSRPPEQVNSDIGKWINDAKERIGAKYERIRVDSQRHWTDDLKIEELEQELPQSPAPFSYLVREGKLHAVPQSGELLDEATANEILPELIEKAREHSGRLSGKGNIAPRLKRNADSLVSALEQWAEQPNPGVLLMRLRSMEADVGTYDTPEGRAELYPDAIAGMLDITRSLEDFVSLQPVAQKMQAAALALHIQRSDVIEINVNIEAIRAAAANMENVDVSVPESLAEGQADFEEATLAIETTADEVKKADAIEKRAEITAYKVMSVRNFGRGFINAVQTGAIEGTKMGVEKVVTAAIVTGTAAAAGAVAGPFIALGVLIASFIPLGKRMKEIADEEKDKSIDV